MSSLGIPNGDDKISLITRLVGKEAVLIPLKSGEKRPLISNWQDLSLDDMADADHQRQLSAAGNIGVLLGSPSKGLCAIDVDSNESLKPFLDLNPSLCSTLQTKGARGAQIWVRIKGAAPKLTKLSTVDEQPWGEWRSDGGQSVIYGRHPSGKDYEVLNDSSPIEVEFSDIKWPETLVLPWTPDPFAELVEMAGEPLIYGAKGSVSLGQMFFVRKYLLEHRVIYAAKLKQIYSYDTGSGLWLATNPETIKRQFLEDLGDVARQTGLQGIHQLRTDATATKLLELLKTLAEQQDAFGKRPDIIHVKNGVIVIKEDRLQLKTFHPDYYSLNSCPFDYDPKAKCPTFVDKLLRAALSDEDISLPL